MEDLENKKRNEIINLYDLYNNLLTEKQKMYFEDYYMDLSLSEIATNYHISRNAIFDQLKKTVDVLYYYEENLHLLEKFDKLMKITDDKNIIDKIEDIIWSDE